MIHILHSGKAILFSNDSQIHAIFDKYEEDSIKSQTREKRGALASAQVHHIMLEVAAPRNWKQFLLRGMNKAGLTKSYTEHMIAKAATFLGD